MRKIWIYTVLMMFVPGLTSAQEIISGLLGNPVVERHYEKYGQQIPYKSEFILYESLTLPFYDDFSDITVYPDTSRWLDNEAYINAEFAEYPVNFGVATMDAIDAKGNVYNDATPFTFLADHLTTRPIRLDSVLDPGTGQMKKLTPADSVYLSFYYQPQGRGDAPMKHDSLVLQFGTYNEDTIFSHFDSTLVWGYFYLDDMDQFGGEWLPPGFIILPYETCDFIPYLLKDTLFLDDSLRIPCDSVFIVDTDWTSIWSAEGDSLKRPNDTTSFLDRYRVYFKDVIIPITDTAWLQNDFQFRFINYASISNINSWQSNTDQWHIDVVYLDYNRNVKDMFVREVSFTEVPPSFINDYSSMPYQHYAGDVTKYKRDNFPVYVHNNDSIAHEMGYNYYVQNKNGDTLEPFLMADMYQEVDARVNQDVFNYLPFVEPPIKYFFTSPSEDTADFYITHLVWDAAMPDVGDTLIYNQKFRNYFSYDDGSAEAGYGLTPAEARLAVKFRTEVPDTLRGIQLYFNKTLNANNDRIFHVGVWGDNDGKPGTMLYKQENVRPDFSSGLNKFYNLVFDESVKLGVQDFYVGWIQTTNHNLNIGYDRNVNSKTKNFYNVNGEWAQSSFDGSIMIRPMVGKALKDPEPEYKSQPTHLQIYPNPPGYASQVTIVLPGEEQDPACRNDLSLRIFDVVGKVIYEGPYTETLPVQGLTSGFYIVNLQNTARSTNYTTKLLITK